MKRGPIIVPIAGALLPASCGHVPPGTVWRWIRPIWKKLAGSIDAS